MGSKRAIDQVEDDIQKLGKYPIRVRVRVGVMVRVRVRVRVRVMFLASVRTRKSAPPYMVKIEEYYRT